MVELRLQFLQVPAVMPHSRSSSSGMRAPTCCGVKRRHGPKTQRLDQTMAQQAGQDSHQPVAQEHRDRERVAQPVALVPALHTCTILCKCAVSGSILRRRLPASVFVHDTKHAVSAAELHLEVLSNQPGLEGREQQ